MVSYRELESANAVLEQHGEPYWMVEKIQCCIPEGKTIRPILSAAATQSINAGKFELFPPVLGTVSKVVQLAKHYGLVRIIRWFGQYYVKGRRATIFPFLDHASHRCHLFLVLCQNLALDPVVLRLFSTPPMAHLRSTFLRHISLLFLLCRSRNHRVLQIRSPFLDHRHMGRMAVLLCQVPKGAEVQLVRHHRVGAVIWRMRHSHQ
jgi:hypothetical protein